MSPFSDDSDDNGISAHSTNTPGDQTETTTEIFYPSGYAASGITDSEKAVEQHISALYAHDSFTRKFTILATIGNIRVNTNIID